MLTTKPARKKPFTLQRQQELWAYAFLLIPLVFFLYIRIYPIFSSFYISLREWDILSPEKPYVGFANFEKMLRDKSLGKVLLNTLQYVIICMPIELVLSLAIALMLNSIQNGAGIYRMLYFIPYVTSTVAVASVWKWMFMKSGGLINNMLLALGMSQQGFLNSSSQALGVVASNVVWQALGFQIIIFLAGLKQIPKIYYEAAEIDGATGRQRFCHVTIPLLNPTIVYLSVMAGIQTLQVFTQVMNISPRGSGGPLNATNSIVLYIYQKGFQSFDMGYASALTVLLFAVIMGVTLFQMKVLNRKVEY